MAFVLDAARAETKSDDNMVKSWWYHLKQKPGETSERQMSYKVIKTAHYMLLFLFNVLQCLLYSSLKYTLRFIKHIFESQMSEFFMLFW